jgi:hypothetical protein
MAKFGNVVNQTPLTFQYFAIAQKKSRMEKGATIFNRNKPGAYLERILEASMLRPRVEFGWIIGHTGLWIRNSFCLKNTYRI